MRVKKEKILCLIFIFIIVTAIFFNLLYYEREKKVIKVELAEIEIKIEKELKIQTYITNKYKGVSKKTAKTISIEIIKAASKHNVDHNLIVGLMELESGFNPLARSKVGAQGLLQVIFRIWSKIYNIEDTVLLYDIAYNIDIGTSILKHYINKNKGDITKALQNYNGSKGTKFSDRIRTNITKFKLFKGGK